MVSIEFDDETGILKMTYSGSVDAVDVSRFIEHIRIDERLPEDLKILHNAGHVPSTLKMKDLLHFSKEMKRGTGRYKTVRAAVYTQNSLSLTLSKLYERLNMDRNTKYKTFNTERGAVSWLLGI